MKKKIILTLVLCALTALSLAACAGTNTENGEAADSGEILGADPSTWGPAEHESLEEAENAAGIELELPQEISGAKPTLYLTWYESEYIEAVYTDGEGEEAARVRKAAGDEDISGDYNDYEETNTAELDGITVTFKGDSEKIMLAVWQNGGYTYAVSVSAGTARSDMEALVRAVK